MQGYKTANMCVERHALKRRTISQIDKLFGIPLRTMFSFLLPIDNDLLILKNEPKVISEFAYKLIGGATEI